MSGRYGGGGLVCEAGCGRTVYQAEKVAFKLNKVTKYWHPKCFVCQHPGCGKRISDPVKHAVAVPNPNSPTDAEYVVCSNCKRKHYMRQTPKVKWTKQEVKSETKKKGSSRYGGGGVKCALCGKIAYSAEQVSFEKKIYHAKCMNCVLCKKNKGPADMQIHEGRLYCRVCYKKEGFARKEAKVSWTPNTTTSTSTTSGSGRWGGGGEKCERCGKVVYMSEKISYDKRVYHPACFICDNCSKKLSPATAECLSAADQKRADDVKGIETKELKEYSVILSCKKCFQLKGYRLIQTKVGKPTKPSDAKKSTKVDRRFKGLGGGGVTCYNKNCTETATLYPASAVSFEGHYYHENCFVCSNTAAHQGKNKKLTKSTVQYKKSPEGEISLYCSKCFHSLGLNRADVKKF